MPQGKINEKSYIIRLAAQCHQIYMNYYFSNQLKFQSNYINKPVIFKTEISTVLNEIYKKNVKIQFSH